MAASSKNIEQSEVPAKVWQIEALAGKIDGLSAIGYGAGGAGAASSNDTGHVRFWNSHREGIFLEMAKTNEQPNELD